MVSVREWALRIFMRLQFLLQLISDLVIPNSHAAIRDTTNQEISQKSAVKSNIPYAIHNDPPVSPPNALHSMWVAASRLTSSGKVLGPDQRITPEQALLAYTREAAIVLDIED